MAHRGPDDEGFCLLTANGTAIFPSSHWEGPVLHAESGPAIAGCCHRRFSILDTSAAGHQPWYDEEAQTITVFNGEIFNYVELRDELQTSGPLRLRSGTDTEVLAHAFRCWGHDCFSHFNGFWAVAIFDLRNKVLVLSRDRFGKKPLYFFQNSAAFAFASEVRALACFIEGGLGALRLDSAAAFAYLLYDRRNTIRDSMWKNIALIPPGETWSIRFDRSRVNKHRFWTLPQQRRTEAEISLNSAAEELEGLLSSAVRLRLRSDVPYAADLSGGMDSSSIVAAATGVLGPSRPLHTNCLVYPKTPELDETQFASAVAERCGTLHSEIAISPEQAWAHFDQLIEAFEEPVHSQAYMTQWLGWKALHERGIKVILHGAAGDELMAGYPYLTQLADLHALNSLRLREWNAGEPWYKWRSWARLAKWTLQGRAFPAVSNPLRQLLRQPDRRVWMPDYKPDLERHYFNPSFLHANDSTLAELNSLFLEANTSLGRRMVEDFRSLRIPFWVNAMDKSMMSLPVEVRMPFLDFRLVDFLLSLPTTYLYRKGWTKYVLRLAMQTKLPSQIVWRRDKVGFSVPKGRWLAENKKFIRDTIGNNAQGLSLFINVRTFMECLDRAPTDYIWRTLNFAAWLQKFKPLLP